jgi:hypothetical protein
MSLDRGVIDQHLQALGESSQWWEERELRDLPSVLHPDERILAIAQGKIGRSRLASRVWLMVVTQRRLLCLRSGRRSGWKQIEVDVDRIERVALRIGPLRGRVLVATSGQTHRLLVPRASAYRLDGVLRQLVRTNRDTESGFAPGRLMHRVVDHVLALPAVALAPLPSRQTPHAAAEAAELRERVSSLEESVQQLREQVAFLEQLLRSRQGAATPGGLLPPR